MHLSSFPRPALTLDKKIEETCRHFPEYACLLTIPGFGPDVSAKVLGALGNPYRFLNHRQVLRIAGLDLSANRSGKASSSAVPVISKQGKADLRCSLYQSGSCRLYSHCGLYGLLHPAAEGTRKRKGHQNQKVGQVIGQAFDHRLDLNEKPGVF